MFLILKLLGFRLGKHTLQLSAVALCYSNILKSYLRLIK
jgi:hypothetical protein